MNGIATSSLGCGYHTGVSSQGSGVRGQESARCLPERATGSRESREPAGLFWLLTTDNGLIQRHVFQCERHLEGDGALAVVDKLRGVALAGLRAEDDLGGHGDLAVVDARAL